MKKSVTFALGLSALVAGCGGNQNLLRDNEKCKGDLASSKYLIDQLKEKNREAETGIHAESERSNAEPPSPEYFENWKDAFSKMATTFRTALDGVPFDMYPQSGALLISLPINGFFSEGKAGLTQGGKSLVKKIAAVLSALGPRDVMIACRTQNLGGKQSSSPTGRDLAAARAVALVKALEQSGVDPMGLIAAGYGNAPEGSDDEEPAVEIVVQPLQEELPEFPDVE